MTGKIIINTDGGSRGNPGKAAVGVTAVNQEGEVLYELEKYIGIATNNEAEYQAFLFSLEWVEKFAKDNGDSSGPKSELKVEWRLDSKLVIEQLNHRWKIKEPRLQQYAIKAWETLQKRPFAFEITYVPREQNKRADQLVNQALDAVH